LQEITLREGVKTRLVCVKTAIYRVFVALSRNSQGWSLQLYY